MPRAERLYIVLLIGLVVAFMAGTWLLMVLRFERGDVYPAYSSLRSDPLGTRAFFDSLASFEDYRVSRHMRPLKVLKANGDAALFILGVSLHRSNVVLREEAEALETFMHAGGRVVITLLPKPGIAGEEDEQCDCTDTDQGPEAGSPNPEEPLQEDNGGDTSEHDDGLAEERRPTETARRVELEALKPDYTTLKKQWGISTASRTRDDSGDGALEEYAIARSGGLPRTISWHSNLYFKDPEPAWKTLYAVADEPVMVERSVGKGSLVLATDSYLLSNEAMKSERLPGLLLYLVGRHSQIIVDETHHGLQQHEGVIGYIRAHRLHWILIAILTVAGLFVWKNAVPLVPPGSRRSSADPSKSAQTRNATQGLANLLRRNIPPKRLLEICFEQWEKAFKKNIRYPAAKRERARRIIEQPGSGSAKRPDPVSGYRAISRTLAEDQPNE